MDVINYKDDMSHAKPPVYPEGLFYGTMDEKPQVEQELFVLQDLFYSKKSEKNSDHKLQIWQDMFSLCRKYAKSLVLKRFKNKAFIDPDEIDGKASQVAVAFMGQYIDRPGYHVGASFAGMINPKVLEVLYKRIPDDKNLSINSLVDSSTSFTEIENLQEKLNFQSLFINYDEFNPDANSKISLKEAIHSVFKEIDSEITDEKTRFLVRNYILLIIQKPKNKHVKKCFKKLVNDFKINQVLEASYLEFYNRLKNPSDWGK